MIRQTWFCCAYVLLFLMAFLALVHFGRTLAAASPLAFGCALGLLVAAYLVGLLVFVTRSNRRQKQIQKETGTDEGFASLQWHDLSRRQQLWSVYGGLGGSVAGSLAWIVIRAAIAKDWLTASYTVLFGVAIVLLGGRALMRKPDRYLRVIVQTLALLAVFTVVILVLHRRDWFARGDAGIRQPLAGQGSTPGVVSASKARAESWTLTNSIRVVSV
jgi:hypothetical protein